jgi:hypothetical protein
MFGHTSAQPIKLPTVFASLPLRAGQHQRAGEGDPVCTARCASFIVPRGLTLNRRSMRACASRKSDDHHWLRIHLLSETLITFFGSKRTRR